MYISIYIYIYRFVERSFARVELMSYLRDKEGISVLVKTCVVWRILTVKARNGGTKECRNNNRTKVGDVVQHFSLISMNMCI